MAEIKILKRDGSPTPYFWSDDDGSADRRKTVYKETAEGRRRMKEMHFNPVTNRLKKVRKGD